MHLIEMQIKDTIGNNDMDWKIILTVHSSNI